MITEFLSKNRRTDEFWCSQLCNGNEASRKTKEDEKSIKQFLTPRTILICLFDVNEIPHNNLLLQDNEIKNILDIFRRLPGIFPGNDKKSVIVPFSTTTVFGVQEFFFCSFVLAIILHSPFLHNFITFDFFASYFCSV